MLVVITINDYTEVKTACANAVCDRISLLDVAPPTAAANPYMVLFARRTASPVLLRNLGQRFGPDHQARLRGLTILRDVLVSQGEHELAMNIQR